MDQQASQSQTLWAPWRAEYFNAPRNPDFLQEAARTTEDKAHLVLLRRRYCFLILNRYPYTTGHLMAVPYQKVSELEALSEGEQLELWELAIVAQKVLRKTVGAQGFNVGLNLGSCAGAGFADHLHLHIVPRREGDHNFMPVLAGAHVLSEALDDLYERLLAALSSLNLEGHGSRPQG
jgi:ATP adenylyltransferase